MSSIETELKLLLSEEEYERLRREAENPLVQGPAERLLARSRPPRGGPGLFPIRYRNGSVPGGDPEDSRRLGWGHAKDAGGGAAAGRPGACSLSTSRRWIHVERDLPEAFRGHFQRLGIRRLRRLGWMRNLRCVVELEPTGSVELDRTVLPGGRVRHEVEIEDPSPESRAALQSMIMALAPGARVSRVGKFSSFLAASGWTKPSGF